MTNPTPTRPEPTTPTREQLSERELRTLIKCCEDAVAGYRRHLPKTANPNLWSMINYADVLAYHLKQRLTSEPAASAPVTPEKFADDAVQWLCELPDRTSPEDWPEACLVTGEELHAYLVEQLTPLLQSAAVPASPAETPKYESGWVIEHGASEMSRPRYWGGVHGWTFENLKAVRFAREEDARSIAESMDDGVPDNYRIAEHGWG